MDKYHVVENVLFQQNQLCLTVDGRHYQYRLDDISTVLAGATREQREHFAVSPGGYGIH